MAKTWYPSRVYPYDKVCARWRLLHEALLANPMDLHLEQEEKAARKVVNDWKI